MPNSNLLHLLNKNKKWAEEINSQNPTFFKELSEQQAPEYLWIGCSDSRVPANQITGLMPGEVFVHRNIANVVVPSDLNILSVLQFAIENLKVKHIIICGHYGCGGVKASLSEPQSNTIIDNWLSHIRETYRLNHKLFKGLNEEEKVNLLCELNVKAQIMNIANTSIVQNAWKNKQKLNIYGWIYGLKNGHLKELIPAISSNITLGKFYLKEVYPSMSKNVPLQNVFNKMNNE